MATLTEKIKASGWKAQTKRANWHIDSHRSLCQSEENKCM